MICALLLAAALRPVGTTCDGGAAPNAAACAALLDSGSLDLDPYALVPWRRPPAPRSLGSCRVLYPGGTGTESLAAALQNFRNDSAWAAMAGSPLVMAARRPLPPQPLRPSRQASSSTAQPLRHQLPRASRLRRNS